MSRKTLMIPHILLRKVILHRGKEFALPYNISFSRCLQLVKQAQPHTRAFSATLSPRKGSSLSLSSAANFNLSQLVHLPTKASISISSFCTTTKGHKKDSDAMAGSQYVVDHDMKNNFFFINLTSGDDSSVHQAKLEYDWISPTLVDMHHTETPPRFQGQGIAKHLAKAAFDYFSEKDITMRPTCTYLQKYIKDNPLPKYVNHVEKSFLSSS